KSILYHSSPGARGIRERAYLQTLTSLKPDIIHFHTASLAIRLAHSALALSIPYTVSLRGSDVQVLPLQDAVYTEKLCRVLADARAIHSVSDAIIDVVKAICPSTAEITTIRTC